MKEIEKKAIFSELKKGDFRVSIFGSARIKKHDKNYKLIYTLGKMLGEKGIDIITGGGPGIMEAANKGHRAGGKNKKTHSIGLAIKLAKGQKPNNSLDVVKEFNTFSARLDNFMLLSNAVIIGPGGIGTLLEFFYTWQLIQVKKICDIPIILLGDEWPSLIKWLEKYPMKRKYFDKDDLNKLFLAKDCKEAIKMIDSSYKEFKKGNKNYCLNYKKYKLY